MTFAYPLLLGGLALVGIPVLIHLIMRQKPKRLPFPAFRFLKLRRSTNRRKISQLYGITLASPRFAIIRRFAGGPTVSP